MPIISNNTSNNTSNNISNKPIIYWILQKNHATPHNLEFFKFFKERADGVTIKFLIPAMWEETMKMAKDLDPIPFQGILQELNEYEWYCRKRDSIADITFPDGLPVWRTLILDDLNSGHVYPITPQIPDDPNLKFIIMQLPVPLGSLENEERMFFACIHWAQLRKIPVIGYELLPFDTKWNLAQSLVDGVITTKEKSYDYLTSPQASLKRKVWLAPRYERELFSVTATQLWKTGLGMPYHFHSVHNLKSDTISIFIPHNVALIHGLKQIVKKLGTINQKMHLMFSVGKDQVRGTHTHQQIVEILGRNELPKFVSHSFHDVNNMWEIVVADCLISCASSHFTEVASNNKIPTLIIDPDTIPVERGYLKKTTRMEDLENFIGQVRASKNKETRLIDIFFEVIMATDKNQNR